MAQNFGRVREYCEEAQQNFQDVKDGWNELEDDEYNSSIEGGPTDRIAAIKSQVEQIRGMFSTVESDIGREQGLEDLKEKIANLEVNAKKIRKMTSRKIFKKESSSREGNIRDKIAALQSQVEEVNGVLIKIVESKLGREQELGDLIKRAENLKPNAAKFTKMPSRKWGKLKLKHRQTLHLVVVVLIVGIIIFITIFPTEILPAKTASEFGTNLIANTTTVHT